MAEFTRVNGSDSFDVGTLWTTAQHKAFLITVLEDDKTTPVDLQTQDNETTTTDGVTHTVPNQAVELIVREVAPLMYYVDDNANGTMHVVVDGHHTSAESLQTRIRNLGTNVNGADVSGTTVTLGTQITVA